MAAGLHGDSGARSAGPYPRQWSRRRRPGLGQGRPSAELGQAPPGEGSPHHNLMRSWSSRPVMRMACSSRRSGSTRPPATPTPWRCRGRQAHWERQGQWLLYIGRTGLEMFLGGSTLVVSLRDHNYTQRPPTRWRDRAWAIGHPRRRRRGDQRGPGWATASLTASRAINGVQRFRYLKPWEREGVVDIDTLRPVKRITDPGQPFRRRSPRPTCLGPGGTWRCWMSTSPQASVGSLTP